jgi:hypothetical protein
MIVLIGFVFLKPIIHLMPRIAMYVLIKLEIFLQVGVGLYGIWVSIDRKLFNLFTKIYGALIFVYIISKIPMLEYINKNNFTVPTIFSPFPFVVAWVLNKAFFESSEKKTIDNN